MKLGLVLFPNKPTSSKPEGKKYARLQVSLIVFSHLDPVAASLTAPVVKNRLETPYIVLWDVLLLKCLINLILLVLCGYLWSNCIVTT